MRALVRERNGVGARGEAEPIIQACTTRAQRVAAAPAVRVIAECHVGRRCEAVRTRRSMANARASEDIAWARAEVRRALAAEGDRRHEWVDAELLNGKAAVGELSVGGTEPLLHGGNANDALRYTRLCLFSAPYDLQDGDIPRRQ
jgi:hypothetical protein